MTRKSIFYVTQTNEREESVYLCKGSGCYFSDSHITTWPGKNNVKQALAQHFYPTGTKLWNEDRELYHPWAIGSGFKSRISPDATVVEVDLETREFKTYPVFEFVEKMLMNRK